jgi:hypothetical protein
MVGSPCPKGGVQVIGHKIDIDFADRNVYWVIASFEGNMPSHVVYSAIEAAIMSGKWQNVQVHKDA